MPASGRTSLVDETLVFVRPRTGAVSSTLAASDGAGDVIWLLAAAVVAQFADLVTFLRASPAVVAADETSPLPHLLGQVAGGVAAKLVLTAALVVIMVAFRTRPRTRAALLAIYAVVGVAGAAVNIAVG